MTKIMTHEVQFANAYYVKLGTGGMWEKDSFSRSLLRFGWKHQSVADINAGQWDTIAAQLQSNQKPGVATTDLNRLRDIAQLTPDERVDRLLSSQTVVVAAQGPCARGLHL